eukprot:g279.t1
MLSSSIKVDDEVVKLSATRWSACESQRRGHTFENSVRLGFEERIIMQKWTFNSHVSKLSMRLNGPIFRRCDDVSEKDSSGACGWGLSLPNNTTNFDFSVDTKGRMKTTDKFGTATTVSTFKTSSSLDKISIEALSDSKGNFYDINVDFSKGEEMHTVYLVISVGDAREPQDHPDDILPLWENACSNWEDRWQHVFQPGNPHFSGSLPVFQTNDKELERIYYSGALNLLALERTNLKLFPRIFTISQGHPNSATGASDMGGSGQFTWDLSFTSISLSLLEPEGTKKVLQFIMNATNFFSAIEPYRILVPQTWDSQNPMINSMNITSGATPYMFDYLAAYQFISTFIKVTGQTEMLQEIVSPVGTYPMTVQSYLDKLANAWRSFKPSTVSSFLADYGSNKRCFLEILPTYTNVIPALQAGNAFMLTDMSLLLSEIDSSLYKDEILFNQNNSTEIVNAMLKFQRNADGDGVWKCLYPNKNAAKVRTVADFVYIANTVGSVLPQDVLSEMGDFAMNELYVADANWVRALSLNDKLNTPKNLLIRRADWGTSGSYGGIPAFFSEAMVIADSNNFERATNVLRACSKITHKGPIGQGIATNTPPTFLNLTENYFFAFGNATKISKLPPPTPPYQPSFPEFFSEDGGNWWPHTERTIANVAAAFTDATIRSFFGWKPDWSCAFSDKLSEASCFFLKDVSRPFEGTLKNLQTKFGLLSLQVNGNGIAIIEEK